MESITFKAIIRITADNIFYLYVVYFICVLFYYNKYQAIYVVRLAQKNMI